MRAGAENHCIIGVANFSKKYNVFVYVYVDVYVYLYVYVYMYM